MKTKLPIGVRELFSGGIFGVGMGAYTYVERGSIWLSVIMGLLSGAAFGFLLGRTFVRLRREATEQLGPLGERVDRRAIVRARNGPVPVDVDERHLALTIIEWQLAEHRRGARRSYVLFGTLLVLEILLALFSSGWFWLAAAMFGGLLLYYPVAGARLERRRHQLTSDR